jgi:hypothetical protein
MQLINVTAVGTDFIHHWGDGTEERYPHWIEYGAIADDGEHRIRLTFGKRPAYGRDRMRILIWIDDQNHAQFLGADDFESTGDVLSEIKIPGTTGERICRYPNEPIPERYAGLPTVGLSTRVSGPQLHNAWAIVANIAEHRIMAVLAALRRLERNR